VKQWNPPGKTRCSEPKRGRMTGSVYEVPGRGVESRTSGAAGSWQVFDGGLVRVVVQGAGWPTNVLVERVKPWAEFVEANVVHTFCHNHDERGRWRSGIIYNARFYPTFEHEGKVWVVTSPARFVRPARGMRKIRS
jgi:hypothetical protein